MRKCKKKLPVCTFYDDGDIEHVVVAAAFAISLYFRRLGVRWMHICVDIVTARTSNESTLALHHNYGVALVDWQIQYNWHTQQTEKREKVALMWHNPKRVEFQANHRYQSDSFEWNELPSYQRYNSARTSTNMQITERILII